MGCCLFVFNLSVLLSACVFHACPFAMLIAVVVSACANMTKMRSCAGYLASMYFMKVVSSWVSYSVYAGDFLLSLSELLYPPPPFFHQGIQQWTIGHAQCPLCNRDLNDTSVQFLPFRFIGGGVIMLVFFLLCSVLYLVEMELLLLEREQEIWVGKGLIPSINKGSVLESYQSFIQRLPMPQTLRRYMQK